MVHNINIRYMDYIPFRIKINSPSNYYLNDKSVDVEKFINGVIINMENINYIITSYLPTVHVNIYYENIPLAVNEMYNNFLFNITVIELVNDDINNSEFLGRYKLSSVVYKLKSVCYKLNKKNNNPLFLTKNGPINISWDQINYDFYSKIDFLPEQLIISVCISKNKVNGLMIGNELIKIYNTYKYLLGIVSEIELIDDNNVKIRILPSYVINLFLKAIKNNTIKIKQNNIGNLWLNINDDGIITDIYSNKLLKNKNFNICEGNKIIKVNNHNVLNGKIYVSLLGLNVPIKTYMWYFQLEKKNNDFININIINYNKTIKLYLHNLNNVLTVDFYHEHMFYDKTINDKYVNIQKMSFELIDYLASNNIYIENKLVYYLFEKPFNEKINNMIVSNHNLFEDYTLLDSLIRYTEDKQLNIYEIQMFYNNKNININDLYKFDKKRSLNKPIIMKIINDDDVILTLNL